MDPDIPIVDAAPVAAHGKLPTESSKGGQERSCTASYDTITGDLARNGRHSNAAVNGKVFLNHGDVGDYWSRKCHFPPGPSRLAEFVQKIKGIGKEVSRGNAFLLFLRCHWHFPSG